MKKFKPFSALSVSRDYTQGMAPALGAEYPGISDRRTGIRVSVLPTLKDGVVVWKWSAEQKSAKLTGNGYKFSNYSRQWQEGFADTFEEGQQIVTDLYAKWMDERPTA